MSTLPDRPIDAWAVARRTAGLVRAAEDGLDADALVAELARWGDELDARPTPAEVAATAAALADLRAVLTTDDVDVAAARLNVLLARWCRAPRLVRHHGWPWHLHVDADDDGPLAEWIGATGAYALAVLLAGRETVPWGACQAAGCDRVFVHDQRGADRRFCSTTCGTRARVARHRRRARAAR